MQCVKGNIRSLEKPTTNWFSKIGHFICCDLIQEPATLTAFCTYRSIEHFKVVLAVESTIHLEEVLAQWEFQKTLGTAKATSCSQCNGLSAIDKHTGSSPGAMKFPPTLRMFRPIRTVGDIGCSSEWQTRAQRWRWQPTSNRQALGMGRDHSAYPTMTCGWVTAEASNSQPALQKMPNSTGQLSSAARFRFSGWWT